MKSDKAAEEMNRLRQLTPAQLKLKANTGDAAAQFVLGCRYAKGWQDIPQNLATAAKNFASAAKRNNVRAMNTLGCLLLEGTGVRQDEQKGVEWLTKASAQNHPAAAYNLAYYYKTKADFTRAAKFATLAVERRHPQAPQLAKEIAAKLTGLSR